MMSMDKKIKEAFDQIHAEEELKSRTKVFLEQYGENGQKKRRRMRMAWIPAVACMMLFLIAGGYWMYFVPTAEIELEVNPSIEIGVNRFDKVVSLEGKNEDGEKLLEELNIRFLNYEDALNRIMENDWIVELVGQDQIVSVIVVGEEETQCETMLASLENFASHHQNVHCGSATSEEAHEAHEVGLGCAKYKAYLELKELDPDITTEEVREMSMREIRDRISELSGKENSSEENVDSGNAGNTGQEKHNRHGHEE